MKFVPTAISRKVADQALLGRKHSPTILFGAGVASMVGSTILACRGTLKLSESLERTKHDLDMAKDVHGKAPEKYPEKDYRKDVTVIWTKGVIDIAVLYAPSIILGGIGVACLTKSHKILEDRNAALTAAYVAVDKAFQSYREKVIDRYGEETDRELRYESEEIDIIDEETGKVVSTVMVTNTDQPYARWFDVENNNWSAPPMTEYNWLFLRNQQNWANDMLKARGHLFLNEVYSMLGLSHTSAGAVVGWVYQRDNENGDNYVDFGCWDQDGNGHRFFENGRDGSILLDFNVDGPIWQLIDELRERT